MLNPVLAMAIGIVVMMVLIIFTKMHAFTSLIISAILIAVLAMPFGPEGATVATLTECVSTVTKGFGNTMASIGVVIGFGCIMGIFLEKSGAAKRMALTILKMVGVKNCDVVLGLTGFVVSIPVFCDSGFVILSSPYSAIPVSLSCPLWQKSFHALPRNPWFGWAAFLVWDFTLPTLWFRLHRVLWQL